jgi:hypothetical protein
MKSQSPTEYKIFHQLSSDVEMIVRGYAKDTDKTEDGQDLWNKVVDFPLEGFPDYSYHIQIKSKVSEDGSFHFTPTIWFENMHVELESFLDVGVEEIENLAEDLRETIFKHSFA